MVYNFTTSGLQCAFISPQSCEQNRKYDLIYMLSRKVYNLEV